jgi:hypothetical protein
MLRKAIACVLALTVFIGTSAESCEEQKAKGKSSLPKTLVVSVSFTSTQAGFDWSVNVPGTRGKPRFWSGKESTHDHSERFEIVEGQDKSVTLTAGRSLTQSYTCEMRVKGGLVKDHQVGVGHVQCFQPSAKLFDPRSY